MPGTASPRQALLVYNNARGAGRSPSIDMAFQPPNPDDKRDTGGLQTLVQAEKLLQIAITIPAAVFIGWLIGAGLDRWLHQHWIYIAGIIFGSIAGLVSGVRMALEAGNAPRAGSSAPKSGPPDAKGGR
jgi:ATP synthase protein I